jgi:hypothetical protein
MKNVSAAGDDDIELEDKYHDTDSMESVSVIDHEIEYLTKFAKTIKDKDERDFFNDKVDSLKFKKSTIQSNIENGYVTPQSYVASVTKQLSATEKLAKMAVSAHGKGNKHVHRLEERLTILRTELKDMADGMSE